MSTFITLRIQLQKHRLHALWFLFKSNYACPLPTPSPRENKENKDKRMYLAQTIRSKPWQKALKLQMQHYKSLTYEGSDLSKHLQTS